MSIHKQAERANRILVKIHASRQRRLGERMVGDHDRPRVIELAATALGILALLAYHYSIHGTMLP